LPVVISVPGLLKERRQRIDISDDLKLTQEQLAASDIYSARVAINVTESECETAAAFDVAVRRAQVHPFVSFWKAIIDVRLISVPTEPTAVRIAMRLINDTAPPSKAQVDCIRLSNAPVVRLRLVLNLSDERSGISTEAAESGGGGEAGCGV
jgi:hypothetical protein